MDNNLRGAFKEIEEQLRAAGFSIDDYKSGYIEGSYSFAADNERYIGSVCHWPKSTFEFQFHNVGSGDVVVLETHEFSSMDSVRRYLNELLTTRLS